MLRRKPANPPISDPTALRAEIELRTTLTELQDHPALLTALSQQERDAERELAEWEREHSRSRRRRQLKAADKAERREQRTATQLANASHRDREWLQRALSARRRALTPDAQLARVFRRSTVTARVLIGVVVLGMLWAGINVQSNIVPDRDASNPLFWISFGIEAMFSVPLILIMLHAQTAAELGEQTQRGTIIVLEVALLGGSIALNAGPHYAAGELGRGLEFSAAPVMIGVAIWLHAWLSNRYARLIAKTLDAAAAEDNASATLDPLAPTGPHHNLEDLALVSASASPPSHHDTPAPAAALTPRTSHLASESARSGASPALAPDQASTAPVEPIPTEEETPADVAPAAAGTAIDDSRPTLAPARTGVDLDVFPASEGLAPASATPDATSPEAADAVPAPADEPRTTPRQPLAPDAARTTSARMASASPAPHQLAPAAEVPADPAPVGARMHQPAPQPGSATRSASPLASATAADGAVVRALPAPRIAEDSDQYEVLAQRILAAELIKKKTPEQIATVLRMLDEKCSHAEINRATKTPYAGGVHHNTIKAIEAAAEQVKVVVRAVR